MSSFNRYWQIFWHFRRISFMRLLEYRGNFFFWGFVSIMWSIFHIFFFVLVLNVSGSIGGWTPTEMYILLANFTIIDAFTWSFFYHNMNEYTAMVFNGSLTQFLVKPIDTQFIVSTQGNSYSNVFRLVMGIGLLIWAVRQQPQPVTISQVLLFLGLLTTSLLFIYSLWFIFSTFSFWVEKLDNINELIPSLRRVYQVPADIYTGIFSFLFTVLLPLGLVTSVPSEALLGRGLTPSTLYFVGFTFLAFCFSRWFFFFSVKKFTGVAN